MTQKPFRRRQLSLDDVAHLMERQCGMSNDEAHALIEDILDHVGERLQDIEAARVTPLLLPAAPAADVDVPNAIPYTEDWDPDFDPRQGLLLLRPDGTVPKAQDT